MNWYLIKIVFQVIINENDAIAKFDEQLRIIFAASKDAAFAKAQKLGRAEEECIINMRSSNPITWKFINVSSLYQLKELLDGAEIYFNTYETDSAEEYIDTINKKAAHIKNSDTLELLQLV
jgi:Domain of unknown function (DUF4288)